MYRSGAKLYEENVYERYKRGDLSVARDGYENFARGGSWPSSNQIRDPIQGPGESSESIGFRPAKDI